MPERRPTVARLLASPALAAGLLAAFLVACNSSNARPPVQGALVEPPISQPASAPPVVTVEFAQDVTDPAKFISVPAGWKIEGDRPGRKFVLRPTATEPRSMPVVTLEPGSPGYEAGLKLHLTGAFAAPSGPIANATALQGESVPDRAALQSSVDQGHTPWRIVPEEAALEYLNSNGLNAGLLLPGAIQVAPDELRLLLTERGTGRRFEVIMERADVKSDHPAWIAVRGAVGF